MQLDQEIENLLIENFNPREFRIINNSGLHSGHMGDDGTGQTHFLVEVESAAIPGDSTVKKHMAINAALKPAFAKTHSIEIRLL